jgi:TonB-linked SusC/RagA family outer membrane protein
MKKSRRKSGSGFLFPYSPKTLFPARMIAWLVISLAAFQLQAKDSLPEGEKISLVKEFASIKEILKAVEKQTEFKFFYNHQQVDVKKTISVNLKQVALTEALDEIFKDVSIGYRISGRQILLFKIHNGSVGRRFLDEKFLNETGDEAPLLAVSGVVTSASGESMPGVNVIQKGTSNGTTTNSEGRYSLSVLEEDAVLVFSFIGFVTQEIALNGRSVIDVSLTESVQSLEEVVITALGVVKDNKSITYATQKVSAAEITKVKDVSFMNSLTGKVAGAVITKGNFGPGSSTKILMRGDKSFISNSEPLYVIDGAPMFGGSDLLANINPEDIEDLQIMKGASAAALYGSQAANGVLLVTTKKGRTGGAKINFSSQFTVENAVDLPQLQTTYGQTDPRFNDSWGAKITNGSDAHLKEFFKPGKTLVNALSISSGNEIAQIYLSYANTDAKGILPENDLTRNNFTIRGTTQLFNKKLSLDGSINYTLQKIYNQNSAGGYSALPGIFSFPTGDDFSKYSGNNFEVWDPLRQMNVQNWPYIRNETFPNQNPYWVQKRNQNDFFRDHTITFFTAKYKFSDWLNIQGRGVYDNIADHYESRIYASTQATVAGPNGGYGVTKSGVRYFYSDVLLMANTDVNEHLSLSATVGASNTRTTSSSLSLSSTVPTSLTFPNYFSVFALNGLFNKSESLREVLSQAIFGNATLGFREKLYLDATARKEWSSTVSQSFFYPSVGLSYVAIDDSEGNATGVSYAKIRGSYAEVGNSLPFGIQNWAPPYSLDNSGNINPRGSLPFFDGADTLRLKPERTKSFELGADIRLLRDRLSVNLTYYNTTTYDQVFQIQAPAGAGATNFWINGGTILNKGIEGILSYRASIGEVNWNPTITFSTNKNQIRELSDLLKADYFALGGSYRVISLFLTRPEDGHYGSYGDMFGKVYEKDADGSLATNDEGLPRVSANFDNYVGNANPKFLMGFNNTFSYKNILASFLIDGRFGGKIFNRTEQWLDYKGLSKRTGEARDNGGVMVEGTLVDAKAFYMNQTGAGAGGAVEGNLYDVTNIRLRELSLGYNFPSFKGIEINMSLVGRNLFFLYKTAPFDPEIIADTSQTSEGISSFTMPSVRSFGVSINATF